MCWGVVEQARHKQLPDEYKNRYIIVVPPSPSLVKKVRDNTVGFQRTEQKGVVKHWPPRYVSW